MPNKRTAQIFLSLFVFIIFGCSGISVEKLYNDGVVATASPVASQIGLDVLKSGGNAVDAAVAVGFALAVCYPEAGNIGGGGFALIYSSSRNAVTSLDFRETAPGAANRDMYLDKNGDVIFNGSLLGARAAGVPGTVAGMYALWKEFGTIPWAQLLQPALKLADTGLIVDLCLAESFSEYQEELKSFSETEKIFLPNSLPLKEGDRFIQKDLAATLHLIAQDSTDGFYSGRTAELIIQTMQKYDGLISPQDLAGYQPIWRAPVHFVFDTLDIYSMGPPSSGGVIIGEILRLLEPFEFMAYLPDSPEYIHLFAEACRLAYADRAKHLGDPEFVNNPIDQMLENSYIESRRRMINPDHAGNSLKIASGLSGEERDGDEIGNESESTTHYCIADSEGNIVSLTYTINTAYGSKLMVDGAGFLLNNEMDDFSIKPGVPNVFGLIGGKANEIAPGKRMLSSMSPTIVLKNGRPILALGSPGGSKIITTVAEAIINFSRFGQNLNQIVERPRFHHQWLPDTLYLETGGFDINVIQDLISRGHIVKERTKYSDLQIIHIGENKLLSGASDPRGCGTIVGY